MLLNRPDTRTLIEAVKIEVESAIAEVSPHARITRALEKVLYAVLSRAIEQGVNLQREASGIPETPLTLPEEEITRKIHRQ